jgi:hypothetical protein
MDIFSPPNVSSAEFPASSVPALLVFPLDHETLEHLCYTQGSFLSTPSLNLGFLSLFFFFKFKAPFLSCPLKHETPGTFQPAFFTSHNQVIPEYWRFILTKPPDNLSVCWGRLGIISGKSSFGISGFLSSNPISTFKEPHDLGEMPHTPALALLCSLFSLCVK